MPAPSRRSTRRPRRVRLLALSLIGSALALTTALAHPTSVRRLLDLDVSVPPGSPAGWAQKMPVLSPATTVTFARVRPADGDAGTTTATARTTTTAGVGDTYGLFRILTWDVGAHLTWVLGPTTPRDDGPVTGGPSSAGPRPHASNALHWTGVATLLRLMLHPSVVSTHETVAHLVELGEPMLPVLEAGAGEPQISDVCRRAHQLISRAVPPPPPDDADLTAIRTAGDARSRTLRRFVREEVIAAHAFDPEGGFGARLYRLAPDMVPFLAEYADTAVDAFARRNAVAALGRIRTAESTRALARVVARDEDPVVLLRAAAALAARSSDAGTGAVRRRLADTRDPSLAAALVQAVGKVRDRAAVPTLCSLGDRALRTGDADTVVAVLSALARLGPGTPGDEAAATAFHAFVGQCSRLSASNPEGFVVEPRGAAGADRPDPEELRGELVQQLAVLCERWDTKATARNRRAFAALFEQRGARADLGRFTNRTLGSWLPPARLLTIETLPALDEFGARHLARIADDDKAGPTLRAAALRQLPLSDRRKRATQILEKVAAKSPAPDPDLGALAPAALALLAGDDLDAAVEAAVAVLERCVEADDRGRRPDWERRVWHDAVALLGSQRALPHRLGERLVAPIFDGHVQIDPRAQIVERLNRLIDDVRRDKVRGDTLAERVRSIVEDATSLRVARSIGGKEPAIETIGSQLTALAARRADDAFAERVRDAIFKALFGAEKTNDFTPVVLLEEEILLAYATRRTEDAAQELVAFLREHPRSRFAGTACLALGVCGQPIAIPALARSLLAPDGWTRFCAAESLRALTQREPDVDWMYGPASERVVAAQAWLREATATASDQKAGGDEDERR